MARVTGKSGALALLSGVNADFNSWRLSFSHPTEDDTSFSDTGAGASKSGSGTVDYSFGCTGMLKSNVASSAPGLGGASAGVASVAGGSSTFTALSGCTEVGVGIFSGGSIDLRKRGATVPVAYDGVIDGDLTETWATS